MAGVTRSVFAVVGRYGFLAQVRGRSRAGFQMVTAPLPRRLYRDKLEAVERARYVRKQCPDALVGVVEVSVSFDVMRAEWLGSGQTECATECNPFAALSEVQP